MCRRHRWRRQRHDEEVPSGKTVQREEMCEELAATSVTR